MKTIEIDRVPLFLKQPLYITNPFFFMGNIWILFENISKIHPSPFVKWSWGSNYVYLDNLSFQSWNHKIKRLRNFLRKRSERVGEEHCCNFAKATSSELLYNTVTSLWHYDFQRRSFGLIRFSNLLVRLIYFKNKVRHKWRVYAPSMPWNRSCIDSYWDYITLNWKPLFKTYL